MAQWQIVQQTAPRLLITVLAAGLELDMILAQMDISKDILGDVRIVKGTAVYTSAFTSPTAPLTAVTNTAIYLRAIYLTWKMALLMVMQLPQTAMLKHIRLARMTI